MYQNSFRALAALLLAALLAVTAAAYEVPPDLEAMTLEEAMADFMDQNGLNSDNFALSYYNTVTGEAYGYNETHMMVAASTFKLPLNLYYYDLEHAGELASDTYIAGAGTTLDDAHYQSLVWSNNEVSIGMLYNLGDFRTYKELMRKYFTMTDEEIEYIYFADNYYCTRMMVEALQYLYENSADFEEMIDYMKEAQPGEYFKAGVPEEYEVAHKYGWYEGAVNDVGIIYTEEPYLLAVYTQDVGAQVVADAAALCTAYNLAHIQPPEPEPEPEPENPMHELEGTPLEIEEVDLPEEPEETPPEEETAPPETMTQPEQPDAPDPAEPEAVPVPWWLPAGAAVVLLALILLVASARRRRYRGKHTARRR